MRKLTEAGGETKVEKENRATVRSHDKLKICLCLTCMLQLGTLAYGALYRGFLRVLVLDTRSGWTTLHNADLFFLPRPFPLMSGFAGFADARFMTVAVRITNNRKHHSTFMLGLRHTALVMLHQ